MVSCRSSGISTPFSSTAFSTEGLTPQWKISERSISPEQDVYFNPHISASVIVELIAARSSKASTTYLYDVAAQAGVGAALREFAASTSDTSTASVVDLQTRVGAGLAMLGRLSEGLARDTSMSPQLTVFTTPTGLLMMFPALIHILPASLSSRLVIHVPNVTPLDQTFVLSPTLAPLASMWSILPPHIVVVLSSTPQQAADFAALAHKFISSHVIHVYDQYKSARETGHLITPFPDNLCRLEDNFSDLKVIRMAGYRLFDIHGDHEASIAIVLLNGPLAQSAAALVNGSCGLSVVIVNVLRPWDEGAFTSALPGSVISVHVVDEVPHKATQGGLYKDVLGTLVNCGNTTVRTHSITPEMAQEYLENPERFGQFLMKISPKIQLDCSIMRPTAKQVLFLTQPHSSFSVIPDMARKLLYRNSQILAHALMNYDMLSSPGGIGIFRIWLSPAAHVKGTCLQSEPIANAENEIDFLVVLEQNLVISHDIFRYSKPNSIVLLVTTWTPEDVILNLPSRTKILIMNKKLKVFFINVKEIVSKLSDRGAPPEFLQNLLVYFVFVRLYLGGLVTKSRIHDVVEPSLRGLVDEVGLKCLNSASWSGLQEMVVNAVNEEPQNQSRHLLKVASFNSISVDTAIGCSTINGILPSSWHEAAKHSLFSHIFAPETMPDSHGNNLALHPEISESTFLITCTVNRRLTPVDYDRNIFHLEFDTTGTGLTYTVGEALGVHGWNDEREVLDFCAWYDVDPSKLLTIPFPGQGSKVYTRTVFQVLQQQIDLFGHPPKSFYTDLAAYALSPIDQHALLFIGSPEGAAMYKKLSEVDKVTFVDILTKYPSSKPTIERLCQFIGDIKPRHYSIASAQSAVGDRVDLLVVTVDWMTPSGTIRHGQCTRYLASLKIGQKVSVTIKPSVMKLPPDPRQPLILAGLGTGAAPFRAFFQHLAWLASKGHEIGSVYYYFGSRHQSSEYLYGEEVESYVLDGIITHAGLAFSRDTTKKVYIQHKICEDSEVLSTILCDSRGVFYLCGPTWPVPDVHEALVNSLVRYKGMDATEAGNYIEFLKEEERYVLEVY